MRYACTSIHALCWLPPPFERLCIDWQQPLSHTMYVYLQLPSFVANSCKRHFAVAQIVTVLWFWSSPLCIRSHAERVGWFLGQGTDKFTTSRGLPQDKADPLDTLVVSGHKVRWVTAASLKCLLWMCSLLSGAPMCLTAPLAYGFAGVLGWVTAYEGGCTLHLERCLISFTVPTITCSDQGGNIDYQFVDALRRVYGYQGFPRFDLTKGRSLAAWGGLRMLSSQC